MSLGLIFTLIVIGSFIYKDKKESGPGIKNQNKRPARMRFKNIFVAHRYKSSSKSY